jgi:hypothetical protein
MPRGQGNGGRILMGTPEEPSCREVVFFLAAVALLGISMSSVVSYGVVKLALSSAPLSKSSIFDQDLRSAVDNYPVAVTEMRAFFTAASSQGTLTVTNCTDYLKLLDQGVRSMIADPPGAQSAYGICPLLLLLRRAREPTTYLSPQSRLARTVAERLDAGTLDGSQHPGVISEGRDIDPARLRFVVDDERRRISSPDGKWSMTILASGSFASDGLENVAVRIEKGRLRHYTILTPRPNGSLAAVSPESMALAADMSVRFR